MRSSITFIFVTKRKVFFNDHIETFNSGRDRRFIVLVDFSSSVHYIEIFVLRNKQEQRKLSKKLKYVAVCACAWWKLKMVHIALEKSLNLFLKVSCSRLLFFFPRCVVTEKKTCKQADACDIFSLSFSFSFSYYKKKKKLFSSISFFVRFTFFSFFVEDEQYTSRDNREKKI